MIIIDFSHIIAQLTALCKDLIIVQSMVAIINNNYYCFQSYNSTVDRPVQRFISVLQSMVAIINNDYYCFQSYNSTVDSPVQRINNFCISHCNEVSISILFHAFLTVQTLGI